MNARPYTPAMGRHRRPVHGGWHGTGFVAALVVATWLGAHGLGEVVGTVLALLALAAIVVVVVLGLAWFAGWAVRAIRAELEAQR